MKEIYETFELKIDPAEFIEKQRRAGVDVDDPETKECWERECVLKSGWVFASYFKIHDCEDADEVRIYPDGTCINLWNRDSDRSCGSLKGKLLKPYEELVEILEDGGSIGEFLDWDLDTYDCTIG